MAIYIKLVTFQGINLDVKESPFSKNGIDLNLWINLMVKGGSKINPANYRPISLTSHVSKVFERVIKSYLIKHLESQNLINTNQHGFVSGRSTQAQLMQHYFDVFDALQEDMRIDTVYLDFAKAFDKVNHHILIEKNDET